jgi:hypothetical protein
MILALRDDWERSNETFRELQSERKRPLDPARNQLLTEILRTNIDFTRWLREAVHRNEVNSKGTVDKNMPQFLRFMVRKDQPKLPDKPKDKTPKNPPMMPN